MFKNLFFLLLQYILPQHLLSSFAGKLADSTNIWLKNKLITRFVKQYKIDMSEAQQEDPLAYQSFNSFFIRQLKPNLRPIALGEQDIACPVDGTLVQMGVIKRNQVIQAKNVYFDLPQLLAGDQELINYFDDGFFSTLYLAPYNYHRIHMPVTGELLKTIYVPGKLFSVNQLTTQYVRDLYVKNERLIANFKTDAGNVTIILVGAMVVSGIKTTWDLTNCRTKVKRQIEVKQFSNSIVLRKGEELGYFNLGSTVILLFEKNKMQWDTKLQVDSAVQIGQRIGQFKK